METIKKKVSFDFDDTLDREDVQEYAKKLVDQGIEVWIVTTRYDNIDSYITTCWSKRKIIPKWHNLFEVAAKVGIKREHIYFTNMTDKYWYFQKHEDFIWHLDDDPCTVQDIISETSVIGISVDNKLYKQHCNELLKL